MQIVTGDQSQTEEITTSDNYIESNILHSYSSFNDCILFLIKPFIVYLAL